MLDGKIMAEAEYWATSSAFSETTRMEIKKLLDSGNEAELTDRFYRSLEFGTGGLRGIMGAGTNRMNIYNVKKATSAIAQYLRSVHDNKKMRAAISYDSRNYSREYAITAAEVLAAYGIEALITKELRPVPILSFMTRKYKCDVGICVTASHNPPEYNGYKVYWSTGGQLVPPHDTRIIEVYNNISSYEDIAQTNFLEGQAKGLIREIGEELDDEYLDKVAALSLHKEGREGFKIVFTPLHGAGAFPIHASLKRYGFTDIAIVKEQEQPDGDFPTVKSPNPEDHAALEMAVKLAEKNQADIVLGTDPDGDRLGLVVRENDKYTYFNGNQIGCLLCEYILSSQKELGRLPTNPLIVKTIVTTDLERDIAEYYGAVCEETLTGFKWIGDLIEAYESGAKTPYRQFICGGEESYGFLAASFVRDKDAVIACSLAAEMVAYYKTKGLTPSEVLDFTFKRHGVYLESLHTVTLLGKDGAEAIKNKMQNLRQNPPQVIDGVQVKKLADFLISQEMEWQKSGFKKSNDIALPKSNVLQFILVDGTKVTARPSGTEPKIKFYFSVRQPVASDISDSDLQETKRLCQKRIGRIQDTFVSMMS